MPFWSFLPLSLFCEIFFCSIYTCCFSHNKFLQLKWFYLFSQETSQISLNNFFLLKGSTLIPIHTRSINHCLYIADPGRTWTAWILSSSSSIPAASLGFARLAMACPFPFCLPSLGRHGLVLNFLELSLSLTQNDKKYFILVSLVMYINQHFQISHQWLWCFISWEQWESIWFTTKSEQTKPSFAVW